MYKKIMTLIISATLFVLPNISFALRCGTKLANIGDHKNEVLLACGNPESKETIGYVDKENDGERIRVLKIEEWIFEKSNQYYSFVFEGSKLIKIESVGRKY